MSVRLITNYGEIQLELYTQHAPNTCRNFLNLVNQHYYDKTIFHRIIPDFCIQGGDPTGTGTGGNAFNGSFIDDEISLELKHTGAGILCMANNGSCQNGSQFFITLAPLPWIDGKSTIFGRVSSGMNIIKKISLIPTDEHDFPTQSVELIKAEEI